MTTRYAARMRPNPSWLAVAAVGTVLACGTGTAQPRAIDVDHEPATRTANDRSANTLERRTDATAASEHKSFGSSLIGWQPPAWQVTGWTNTAPLEVDDLQGKVVVVRFWTDTCPFCRASMPALQGLAEELAGQPVVFVGVYHEKPRGRADAWAGAKQIANDWGITFPLAHDNDWATLRSWWLDTGERSATSATIVLGPDGKVIHVHPGPVYFPSDDERHANENRDFVALREAVVAAIPRAE